MSISSLVESSPISSPLNPLVLENPRDIARALQSKSFNYNLISKICAVAFLAIVGVVLAISWELIIVSSWASLFLLAPILSTPFLFGGIIKFHVLSLECKKRLEFENSVIKTLEKLEGSPLEQFYQDHSFLQIEKSSNLHLLVARVIASEKRGQELLERIHRKLYSEEGDWLIRLEERTAAWELLETQLIPLALNTAVMYKILKNPSFPHKTISDLGTVVCKDFSRRYTEKLFDKRDDYFIANESSNLQNLSLEEISRCTYSPQKLYSLLFLPIETLD